MIINGIIVVSLAYLAHGIEIIDKKEVKTGCVLNLKSNFNLPYPEPLLLKKEGNNDGLTFHLPKNNSGVIELSVGDVIRIGCTGGYNDNYFYPVGAGVREVNATCMSNGMFDVEGRHFYLHDLICKVDAYEMVKSTKTKCSNDSVLLNIGFLIRVDYIAIMEICFDELNRNTLWSRYQLVGGVEGRQKDGRQNTPFVEGTFYPGIDIDLRYSRRGQRDTLANILGSYEQVDKYINSTSGDYFLSRGHLAPSADFVYYSQHIATYHYINVAPQWQTFNDGNWAKIENSLRLYVNKTHLDLDVYTGTHGVTTLPDINGLKRELWLYRDKNNNQALPVPKLYWKVAYDPKTLRGVALLGVNNPYIVNPANDVDYKICNDVCNEISWLNLSTASNVTLGYSYCCEVEEFRRVVPTMPALNVTGGLLKN